MAPFGVEQETTRASRAECPRSGKFAALRASQLNSASNPQAEQTVTAAPRRRARAKCAPYR